MFRARKMIRLTSCTTEARLSKICMTSSMLSKPMSSAISPEISSFGREDERVECRVASIGSTFGFLGAFLDQSH